MKERIFICTHSQLPRGDANSNYIFHMALSLAQEGFEVIAIGRSKSSKTSTENVEGVLCVNIARSKRLPAKIEGHIFFGSQMIRQLRNYHIRKEDYVILYGGYVSLFRSIANKMSWLEKGHVTTCVVEWPTKQQFRWKGIDPNYLLWKYVFNTMIPKWKKVVAISENLRSHFAECGCDTFLLPPMINAQRKISGERKSSEKLTFIYAGADTQKDDIRNMLLAVEKLSDQDRNCFDFHITSLTKEKAEKLLGAKQYILEVFSECLHIHGWMEYDELINLYYSSDYLLLARETNQFTRSNFPSKVPEMMNYGIIPVCSQVGDYTDMYLHHMIDSVIFEGSSSDACADAIRTAISISKEKRICMSQKAIENARDNFDYRQWGKKLSNFVLY